MAEFNDREERENNVQVDFNKNFPRPYAFEIHRWLEEDLNLPENEVLGVQLDTIMNCLFLKIRTPELCNTLVEMNDGTRKFRHLNGQISDVYLSHAGFGLRTVRIFNLPFETRLETISRYLKPYGKVIQITKEKWSSAYRYQVDNGIRSVKMVVHKHIPSFMIIAGHRAFITYDGQPQTCSLCHSTDHLRQQCPRRRRPAQLPAERQGGGEAAASSYATVASRLVPARRGADTLVAAPVDVMDTTPAISQADVSEDPVSGNVLETVRDSETETLVDRLSASNVEVPVASDTIAISTPWYEEVVDETVAMQPAATAKVTQTIPEIEGSAGLEPAPPVCDRPAVHMEESLPVVTQQAEEPLVSDVTAQVSDTARESQPVSETVVQSAVSPVAVASPSGWSDRQATQVAAPQELEPKSRRDSCVGTSDVHRSRSSGSSGSRDGRRRERSPSLERALAPRHQYGTRQRQKAAGSDPGHRQGDPGRVAGEGGVDAVRRQLQEVLSEAMADMARDAPSGYEAAPQPIKRKSDDSYEKRTRPPHQFSRSESQSQEGHTERASSTTDLHMDTEVGPTHPNWLTDRSGEHEDVDGTQTPV